MCSNLVSSNKLDGSGVITMPGSFSVPNSGSLKKKKTQVAKWGTLTKKKKKKKVCVPIEKSLLGFAFCDVECKEKGM